MYEKYATTSQNSNLVFDTKASEKWGKAYNYYFRQWLPKLTGVTILDAGCGQGDLFSSFKARGFINMSGIDRSPEQVAVARQHCEFVECGDLFGYLREKPYHFDLFNGLDIIEHFRKDEILGFLTQIYQSLKAGGRVMLQTPNEDRLFRFSVRSIDFKHGMCLTPSSPKARST